MLLETLRDCIDYLGDGRPDLLGLSVVGLIVLGTAQAVGTATVGFDTDRKQIGIALAIAALLAFTWFTPPLADFPMLVIGVPVALILGTAYGWHIWPQVLRHQQQKRMAHH
ncbi:MAG: hypothetical protein ACM3TU_00440 [Bacillota bacterium]